MKNVTVVVYGIKNKYPDCQEERCAFKHTCANHRSAGEFRNEDGLTPDLKEIDGVWKCSQNPINANGAIMADGSLLNYSSRI